MPASQPTPTSRTPQAQAPVGSDSRSAGLLGGALGRAAPLGLVAVAAAAVTVRDPHVHGAWGVCPTYALLGVYCPGCGTLRALHDLVAGRLWESIGHNALVIPAILFLGYSAIGRPGPRWSRAWVFVLAIFTIARNLPGSPLAA